MNFDGEWLYVWARDGWDKIDLAKTASDAHTLGYDGVILHSGMGIAHEVSGAVDRVAPFAKEGLRVALGMGYPKLAGADANALANDVIAALRVPGTEGVVHDAEGGAEGHADVVNAIADRVLASVPDAASRGTVVPFWAWKTDPQGHGTHPRWPAAAFARLICRFYPQTYGAGAGEGASARFLAWSRNPSQYPSATTPPLPIDPCVQAYKRSVADHVALYTANVSSLSWNVLESDAPWRAARLAKVTLAARGFTGADAVRRFQASAGLTADNVCGPKTCASLGVAYPAP